MSERSNYGEDTDLEIVDRKPLCPICKEKMTSGRVPWFWYCMNRKCKGEDVL